MRSRQPT